MLTEGSDPDDRLHSILNCPGLPAEHLTRTVSPDWASTTSCDTFKTWKNINGLFLIKRIIVTYR